MGKRYAPHLADIYMARFDKYAKHGFSIKLKNYFRFLDDIFLIWPASRQALREYEEFLNTLIPGIKVTFTVRQFFTEFLDVRIYKSQNCDGCWTLKTKVYFKPTDTHQLLHKNSFHPRHCCTGVLKSQFIRYKRISSDRQDYNESCTILWNVLRNRGYTYTMFWDLKEEIWRNYDGKIQKTVQEPDNIMPVVTYYDPINRRISEFAKTEIRNNPHFEDYRAVSAYKIHKNLRRHLIQNGKI